MTRLMCWKTFGNKILSSTVWFRVPSLDQATNESLYLFQNNLGVGMGK